MFTLLKCTLAASVAERFLLKKSSELLNVHYRINTRNDHSSKKSHDTTVRNDSVQTCNFNNVVQYDLNSSLYNVPNPFTPNKYNFMYFKLIIIYFIKSLIFIVGQWHHPNNSLLIYDEVGFQHLEGLSIYSQMKSFCHKSHWIVKLFGKCQNLH